MNLQISEPETVLDELFGDARLFGKDIDPIVGLVHRQYFVRDLNRRAYECSRYKVEVAVVLIRIINLNASFRNKAQLVVELDNIGTMLDENIRLTDLATWYSADEFAIQMPHATQEEAKQACKRIVAMLDKGLSFDAVFDSQVYRLDDSFTADVLLRNLRGSATASRSEPDPSAL